MINPFDMTQRTFLVTGASSGIGRATSIFLSQLGARLILVARDEQKLEITKSALGFQSDHIVAPFDLSKADAIPGWLKSVCKEAGPLDGLVHSAGIFMTRPVRFLKNQEVQSVFNINVNASVALARAFRQKSVYKPGSSIVYLSSVAGLVGSTGISAYSASKGAIIALTKSLALEFARDNIRVNCVAPGQVYTEMLESLSTSLTSEQSEAIKQMHPLGMGEPEDVAYAIAFLLAKSAKWITGSTLIVDGGYTAQ